MPENIIIRIATTADAEKLLKIYAPYVLHTAITFEYSVPTVEEFASRIVNVRKKYPYLVAERDGEVLGYAYASPFHSRAAYQWGAETSIYVDSSFKQSGIGGKLYEALELCLKEQGILNLNACIAFPETADEHLTKNSVEFHAHLGYRMVGEFYKCGYKFGRWYNMVWMEKHIGEHVAEPAEVKSFDEVKERIKERTGIYEGNTVI